MSPSELAGEWAELAYQFSRFRKWRDPELARECLRMMFDYKRLVILEGRKNDTRDY